ncbi:hypothetical protein DASC09_012450 [Saccharomycopsis crataegensis]|uniref:Uncharacterized protein n=1 Tax=Saccharomycopsis crataegensis TaxID=43959 RepID=A0AAV5QHR4_9ASCO|nr:hypothetical protein DASC09_012450 [Saccharomycopsis crataegensis]
MIFNPEIVNRAFIRAVVNWLCQFNERAVIPGQQLREIITPQSINKILKSLIDSSIIDYSSQYDYHDLTLDEEILKVKLRYFEVLVNVMTQEFIKCNTRVISPNAIRYDENSIADGANVPYSNADNSIYDNFGDGYGAPIYAKDSSNRPFASVTRLSVSESYKNDRFNYFLRFITPAKLFAIVGEDTVLTDNELIQIQSLFALFIELGIHCQKAAVCITLCTFLDENDRAEFQVFFGRSPDDTELSLSAYDNEISLTKGNFSFESDFKSKELLSRLSKLENDNLLLKNELSISRRRQGLYLEKIAAMEESARAYKNNSECVDDLLKKFLDKRDELETLYQENEALSIKGQQDRSKYESMIEELKAEICILKEKSKRLSEVKVLQDLAPMKKLSKSMEFQADDYVESLKWDLDIANNYIFGPSMELLRSSNFGGVKGNHKGLIFKNRGREIHNLFAE